MITNEDNRKTNSKPQYHGIILLYTV